MAAAGGTWSKSGGAAKSRRFVPMAALYFTGRRLGLATHQVRRAVQSGDDGISNTAHSEARALTAKKRTRSDDNHLSTARLTAAGLPKLKDRVKSFVESLGVSLGISPSPYKTLTGSTDRGDYDLATNTVRLSPSVEKDLDRYIKTGAMDASIAASIQTVIHEKSHQQNRDRLIDDFYNDSLDTFFEEGLVEHTSRRRAMQAIERDGHATQGLDHTMTAYRTETSAVRFLERLGGQATVDRMLGQRASDRYQETRGLLRPWFEAHARSKGYSDPDIESHVRRIDSNDGWIAMLKSGDYQHIEESQTIKSLDRILRKYR